MDSRLEELDGAASRNKTFISSAPPSIPPHIVQTIYVRDAEHAQMLKRAAAVVGPALHVH